MKTKTATVTCTFDAYLPYHTLTVANKIIVVGCKIILFANFTLNAKYTITYGYKTIKLKKHIFVNVNIATSSLYRFQTNPN